MGEFSPNSELKSDHLKYRYFTSEQEKASLWRYLGYTWISPLLRRGLYRYQNKEELLLSDLLRLPSFERPTVTVTWLKREWEKELLASTRVEGIRGSDEKQISKMKSATPDNVNENTNVREPSLPRTLMRAYWNRFVLGGLLRLISDGFSVASPFILRELLKWLQSPREEPVWKGFVFVAAITVANLFMSWSLNASNLHTTCCFAQMSNGLQLMIFDKILSQHPEHGETGHLTSLHASDAHRLLTLALVIHGIWVTPLLIIASAIAMYFFVGWAGVIAVACMALSSPIQSRLTRLLMSYRTAIIRIADRRVHAVNEVLQGIRICKFMNWETNFEQRIASIREEEIVQLRKSYFMRAFVMMIAHALPSLVSLILFGLVFAFDGDIEPARVFPALSLINVIRIPMIQLPMAVGMLLENKVSVKRIENFLKRPDIEKYVEVVEKERGASLENVTVTSRCKNVMILSNVSCHFPANKLSLIYGPTGCGKSTLVKALIGEATVNHSACRVQVGGTVAYMSQEAWIMNATVRDNIIMDVPFDLKRYWRVVRACQLIDDFKQLSHGDMTEIGERGVNLSGGQKQRIAFARAAYSDKDIIVMDDPLSAVDAHVCHRLFNDCIMRFMKNKTRILVTHQTQFLEQCDYVVQMEDRQIVKAAVPTSSSAPVGVEGRKDARQKAEGQAFPLEGQDPMHNDLSNTPLGPVNDENNNDDDVDSEFDGEVPGELASAPLMGKEKVVLGEVEWGVYGWLIKLGSYTYALSTVALFALWRASSVITDMWLTWWSSRDEPFGRNYTNKEYLMFFGICTGITIFLIYLRHIMLALFTVVVCRRSHAAMVARLIRAPTSFFDTTPMGRILNRFTKDMDGLDVRIPDLLSQILNTSFTLIGMLILVAITAPFILVLVPFLGIVIRMVYVEYSRTQRTVKQLESVSRSPVLAVVNETLGGLSTIRAFGMVRHFREKHDSRADIAARPAYNSRCAQRWLSSRTELIGTVILFFAAYVCAISRVTGLGLGVSPQVIGLSLTYVISTTNTVTFLNRNFAEFEADMNCTERVMEYGTQVPQERDVTYTDEIRGGPDTNTTAHREPSATSTAGPDVELDDEPISAPGPDWGRNGTISFENVSLRYRPNLPLVLKKVSFSVKHGMKVGIVGRTGSGKSTIILALFRMIELEEGGRICIDGRDIARTKLSDLRSKITIIPQDPVLFAGTLRSNLDPFDNYSDEELWDALTKSNIKDRIASDADGLLCKVTERGANFSVGERQLLCLARAILRRCSILLLDEATANVDYHADQLIQNTIRTVFKECTVITVAHRLSTIIDADKVVVMGGGEVLEDASPYELLSFSENADGPEANERDVDSSSDGMHDVTEHGREEEDARCSPRVKGIFRGMVKQLGDDIFHELCAVAREHYVSSR